MNGRELAFFPRYTSMAGGATSPGQDVFSQVFEVVRYKTLVVEGAILGAIGTGAAVKIQLQTGSDLDFSAWEDVGSEETLAGTPVRIMVSSPLRYVRLRANLSISSGSAMAATLWALGIAREV